MANSNSEKFKSGMVSIVGRPNVGKSTLLNSIVGEKIAIVSKVPQTTRNQVRGIYGDERGQIVFIDTPGLHMGKDKLDKFMHKAASSTVYDVDCVIHLVDVRDEVGPEEEAIAKRLRDLDVPVILGLNKVDQKANKTQDYIALWERVKGKPIGEIENLTMITLSGKKNINIDSLLDILYSHLPEGPALYPADTVCDIPRKMVISDIIREKLINILRHELPHSIAVVVESMQPRKRKTIHISALILVERDTHKIIVIGKKGDNLKRIGTYARKELEDLLESKVFLELHVKTKKNWRDNSSLLREMGYDFM
ncbi:MAG: GTPase Era [Candidatus Omnitrophica bacterium]|nr:GTPase Era [Candidatus Omnitrophota bacterium]